MIFYVDIDNTICLTNDTSYENSIPLFDKIKLINDLYKKDHTIIYWTARGSVYYKPYLYEMTKNQLDAWGCLYHELRFGKPVYDYFIDDKNINITKDIDINNL
jgi:hypothetical protein